MSSPAGGPTPRPSTRSRLTLALYTLLHGFTHAYGTLLVPLYLLIARDLDLDGVNDASLLVTVYGLVYCLGSFGGGLLADHTNRKALLGVGLLGNAAAILLMGLTRQYELLVLLAVVAGLAGTLFHPAANALVTAHYPRNPGMAIGILGMGAGVGFFAGPQYAGWRATTDWWPWPGVADWQRPCVEMGLLGLVVGVAFLFVAREVRAGRPTAAAGRARRFDADPSGNGEPVGVAATAAAAPAPRARVPMGPRLRWHVFGIALVLACRDFAGVASISLASIYLQRAHDLDAGRTGLLLGAPMLMGVVVNPLAVAFSPGRRRLPALAAILAAGGLLLAATPHWPVGSVFLLLCAFQACHLGSYAVGEAALLERVSPAVRGRVVGLFLMVAGTIASTAPWLMGSWTDAMGAGAETPAAYAAPFGVTGGLIAVASASVFLIARLGDPPAADEPQIDPLTEITPATMEPAG